MFTPKNTADNPVPNLDAMETGDLTAFWMRHRRGLDYKILRPEGGKGAKRGVAGLANYASNKAAAMQCRLRGDVRVAIDYEDICERIYNGLPDWAKW